MIPSACASARPVRRIAVLGISGSGKSTFSRCLADQVGLPIYHMDRLFWQPGWVETPFEDWARAERDIVARDEWILEGYVDPACPERVRHADLVLYLDYSGLRCAWNGLKRWLSFRGRCRDELPGCPEKLDLSFLWTMLARKERPLIEAVLSQEKLARVLRFQRPAQAQRWLRAARAHAAREDSGAFTPLA